VKARPNQPQETLQARRKRRWTFYVISGVLLMGYFTYSFFFDTMGFMKYLNMKRTHSQIAEETKTIEEENARLRKDIEAVKHDPATLEGLARVRPCWKARPVNGRADAFASWQTRTATGANRVSPPGSWPSRGRTPHRR